MRRFSDADQLDLLLATSDDKTMDQALLLDSDKDISRRRSLESKKSRDEFDNLRMLFNMKEGFNRWIENQL